MASGNDLIPEPKVEVNFEDDPLQRHPAYLTSLLPLYYARLGEVTGTTANDLGSGNNDGTYTGTYTLGTAGAWADYGDLDTAVHFDGTTAYVEHPAIATWQNLHAAWTLGAWIYPTVTRASDTFDLAGVITSHDTAVDQAPFPFAMWYGTWNSVVNNVGVGFHSAAAGLNMLRDPNAVTLNTWAFYIGTWDGTTLNLYKNGSQVATSTPSAANAAASGTRRLRVGKQDYDVAPIDTRPFFPGRIDEVFILDYALGAVEIANLYRYLSINDPDEGNYVDLSDRWRSHSTRRGRSDNTSRIEAGSATVVLDNTDGVLFPDPIVNRLANPSYEAPELNVPFTIQSGVMARDVTQKRTGNYSWKLTTTTAGTAYLTTERDGLVGMRPGETVTFSGYPYIPTPGPTFGTVAFSDVVLELVDEVAGVQQITTSGTVSVRDTFANRLTVTRTIRTDADAAYARLKFVSGGVANRSAWFDDAQLEAADAATSYCDGDQTDCRWGGEPHLSLSHRKRDGSYSKIVPMRRARVQGVWDSTEYGTLAGYITSWNYNYPGSGVDSTATITIVDATRVLAAISMRGFTRSSERPGDRIRAIFDYVGINPADYSVDDTNIEPLALSAQAAIVDDTTALELIRRIEETERGVLLADGDGVLVYQGSLLRSTEGREAIILGDDGYRYIGLSASLDVQGVVNDTRIENLANPSTDHHFIETESQLRYFTASAAENSYWSTDNVSYVDRSVPLVAASEIELAPAIDPAAMWPDVLALELGALARVDRVHNGIDVFTGELQTIEGISHDARPGNWTTRLLTAPALIAPVSADPWQTPISKPILVTSKYANNPGDVNITMPSATYTIDRLYLLLFTGQRTDVSNPSVPTFTSAHTWNAIRTADLFGGGRMACWWAKPTATNTEALGLNFATKPNFRYDVVVLEIRQGFNATPIADNTFGTAGSGGFTGNAVNGAGDVGTLTDSRSVVIWHLNKDIAAFANWSGAVELYDRAGPTTDAVAVAYGFPPGVDSVAFNWGGQANGWAGQGFEVQAT